MAEKQKFAAERKHQYEELKADQKRWNDNKEKIEALYTEEIVDLDVGGTHKITTTRQTLTSVKESSLAAMFSGRFKLNIHNGRIFIDRDGEAFTHMLNFLRTKKVPIFTNQHLENAFYDELDYWMIPTEESPLEVGDVTLSKTQTFDSEWCADTLILNADHTQLTKQGVQHGIVFCS